MHNLYQQFRALLPDPPLQVGTVIAVSGGIVTVQMPGGERVPFLFSVKNLVATGSDSTIKPGFEMGGSFTVPSYRTGLFLDPKGRGTTTGYDFAGALPGLSSQP